MGLEKYRGCLSIALAGVGISSQEVELKAEGESACHADRYQNEDTTTSHLPPNYCNVPKKQLWELCTSLVPVLAVTVTPSLQLWWFPVPWLYTVPSSGGFLCMSASQVVPHC